MKSVLFWGITQRRMVILYRRFGTTYRSQLLVQEIQEEDFLTVENLIDTLSRNVGEGLPFEAT
jgi:hypothetical protein